MDDEAIRDQGIEFQQHRFESGQQTYKSLKPAIERLRRVALSYVGEVFEPDSALAWLEDPDNGPEAA